MASINLHDIVKQIALNERTGSLLCLDEQGKLGRIYFLNGRVANARYDRIQGREALDHVMKLKPKSIRFHDGRDMVRSKHAIQENSETNFSEQANASNNLLKNQSDNSGTDSTSEAMPHASKNDLTPEVKQLLHDELAEHIGPVAQLVIDSLSDQISLKDAIKTLAMEIGDRNAAIRFINAMRAKTSL